MSFVAGTLVRDKEGVVTSVEQASEGTKTGVVTITTKNGYTVSCSEDQEFLIVNPETLLLVGKKPKDIQPNEWICMSGIHKVSGNGSASIGGTEAFFYGMLTKASFKEDKITYVDHYYRFNPFITALAKYFKIDLRDKLVEKIEGKVEYENSFREFEYELDLAQKSDICQELGTSTWNEYTSFVPKILYSCSFYEIIAFMRAIFIQYRHYDQSYVNLTMKSKQLALEIKYMLLNYFQILTGPIEKFKGSSATFRILDPQTCVQYRFLNEDNTKVNLVEYFDYGSWINQALEQAYVNRHSELEKSMLRSLQGIASSPRALSFRLNHKDFEQAPGLVKILKNRVFPNTLYEKVESVVVEDGSRYTYPINSNVYTANGFLLEDYHVSTPKP